MAEWGLDRGDSGSNDSALARGRSIGASNPASTATLTQIADAIANGANNRAEVNEAIAASHTEA